MVKVLITGDFCPQFRIENEILKGNLSSVYNDFYSKLIGNDLNITNLECPLITEANALKKSGPNLKASPKCIDALTYGGFNLVTLANNHIMDYDANGLMNTLELCQNNNIAYLGAGTNLKEAEKTFYYNKEGLKIAILNFTENEFSIAGEDKPGANPLNPINNFYKIREARELVDFVFVIVHGGHENFSLPSPRMVNTYRFFIESGADFVIGHHTHCFSGYEEYKNGKIFYGLGNFLFDWKNIRNSPWNKGYALKFFLDGTDKATHEIIPYMQGDHKPGIELLDQTGKQDFEKEISILNSIIKDSKELELKWKEFAKSRTRGVLNSFVPLNKYLQILLNKLDIPLPLSEKRKLRLLNLTRCESHRDIVLHALE